MADRPPEDDRDRQPVEIEHDVEPALVVAVDHQHLPGGVGGGHQSEHALGDVLGGRHPRQGRRGRTREQRRSRQGPASSQGPRLALRRLDTVRP